VILNLAQMLILNFALLFAFAFSKDSLTDQNLKLRKQNRALRQALKSLTENEIAVAYQGAQARLVSISDGQPLQLNADRVEGLLQVQTENGWAYATGSQELGWEGARFACQEMGYDIPAHPVQYTGSTIGKSMPGSVKQYVSVDCQGGNKHVLSDCAQSSSRFGAVKQRCTKLNYCPESASFSTNNFLVKYWYELTATSGKEHVLTRDTASHEDSIYFEKNVPTSRYSSCYLEIEFVNDAPGRDLFFKPLGVLVRNSPNEYIPVGATIKLKDSWSEWNCGKSRENYRCKDVRAGKFYWRGTYQITFNQASNSVWKGYGSMDG